MNNILNFTAKMLGIQGLKVIHTYVNNGILQVTAQTTTNNKPFSDFISFSY